MTASGGEVDAGVCQAPCHTLANVGLGLVLRFYRAPSTVAGLGTAGVGRRSGHCDGGWPLLNRLISATKRCHINVRTRGQSKLSLLHWRGRGGSAGCSRGPAIEPEMWPNDH